MSAPELRAKIEELISNSSATVLGNVAQHFADIEIRRREQLVINGLTQLKQAEADLDKIKPDHTFFTELTGIPSVGWSAAQKGKRDKAQGLVDRLTTGLASALQDGDFKKLEEVIKQSGSSSKVE